MRLGNRKLDVRGVLVRKLVLFALVVISSLLFAVVGSVTSPAIAQPETPPPGCTSGKLCFEVGVTAAPGVIVTRNPADTCSRVDNLNVGGVGLYPIRHIYNNSDIAQRLYNGPNCPSPAVYLLLPHFGYTPGTAGTNSLVYSYSPDNSDYPS